MKGIYCLVMDVERYVLTSSSYSSENKYNCESGKSKV